MRDTPHVVIVRGSAAATHADLAALPYQPTPVATAPRPLSTPALAAMQAARRAMRRAIALGVLPEQLAANLVSTSEGPYLHSVAVAGLTADQARRLAEGLLAWSQRCGQGRA